MTTSDLPILRPAQVTAPWLTEVLRRGGYEATVKDFTAKRVGTGQVGDMDHCVVEG